MKKLIYKALRADKYLWSFIAVCLLIGIGTVLVPSSGGNQTTTTPSVTTEPVADTSTTTPQNKYNKSEALALLMAQSTLDDKVVPSFLVAIPVYNDRCGTLDGTILKGASLLSEQRTPQELKVAKAAVDLTIKERGLAEFCASLKPTLDLIKSEGTE